MFKKEKEENERKLRALLHDAKIFFEGAAISAGLVIGLAIGVNITKR